MENQESILEELEKFEKKSGVAIPKLLEEYIQHVAKTGDPVFPWQRIRNFMRYMLETVMNEFYENCGGEDMSECGNVPAFSYTATRDKLLRHFDTFTGAPFTIQRLCEIMVDPTRHYKRTDKFLRGLEKNVLVVSNIEPGRQMKEKEVQKQQLLRKTAAGVILYVYQRVLLYRKIKVLTVMKLTALPKHITTLY
ncbi:hypothetical protein OTU49_007857 [Cherax quadricarinatus]|uniref:Serine/threonine-protein phosphatase 4 regulatory subunit 2 n=1 Tax=Cherax quadricarinatus TaxID=27406 RepID=A0AAW0YM20_CHEQU